MARTTPAYGRRLCALCVVHADFNGLVLETFGFNGARLCPLNGLHTRPIHLKLFEKKSLGRQFFGFFKENYCDFPCQRP